MHSSESVPEKCRVVHVTSVHVWSDTRIFQRMCRSLARNGWDVHLVAPRAPTGEVESVKLHGIEVPGWRPLRALVGGLRAVVAARKLDADIYHLHDAELLLWSWLLRGRGRILLYDMHEYVPGAIMTRGWVPRPARRLLARLWTCYERIALRSMPVVFAEYSYAKHYRWIGRSAVILNMPDVKTLLETTVPKTRRNQVVYVGAVSKSRGSFVTLQALRLLQDRGIEVEFDCIGRASASHMQELEQRVRELSLPRVRFHGYLPPGEAWRVAGGATAGLAVLQPEPNYMESYPTKIFEYMALRIPVIASDFPLYREVVLGSDCGACVSPDRPDALADALETLIAHPAVAARRGENGRKAVLERYRWEPQLDALESFYRSLNS